MKNVFPFRCFLLGRAISVFSELPFKRLRQKKEKRKMQERKESGSRKLHEQVRVLLVTFTGKEGEPKKGELVTNPTTPTNLAPITKWLRLCKCDSTAFLCMENAEVQRCLLRQSLRYKFRNNCTVPSVILRSDATSPPTFVLQRTHKAPVLKRETPQ